MKFTEQIHKSRQHEMQFVVSTRTFRRIMQHVLKSVEHDHRVHHARVLEDGSEGVREVLERSAREIRDMHPLHAFVAELGSDCLHCSGLAASSIACEEIDTRPLLTTSRTTER